MRQLLKFFALVALLLLPLRMAEARSSLGPDAVMTALDLGHCSGGDADKQHGRTHTHCSLSADAAPESGRFRVPRVPERMTSLVPDPMSPKGIGLGAPTPPPRRA